MREVLARKMDVESVDRLVKKLEGVVASVKTASADASPGLVRPSPHRSQAGSSLRGSPASTAASPLHPPIVLGDLREPRGDSPKQPKRGTPRVLASALV
jgi:hypothetical protein